jgi:hypothetical protein
MVLTDRSRLVLRLRDKRIRDVLPLAGKQLRIGGASVYVGLPEVWALTSAAAVPEPTCDYQGLGS